MSELLVGFFFGIFVLLAVETTAIIAVFARIFRKKKRESHRDLKVDCSEDDRLSRGFRKKGIVWVLDPEKLPRAADDDNLKFCKDQRVKRKILEVSPSRKYAKIVDHSLSLIDVNSRQEEASIQLTDCIVLAVSGSDQASRKWAKRYPIKIEGKKAIYNGSEVFYLYLENSWEKEAWCKALRQASCLDTDKLYTQLRKEFSEYTVLCKDSENFSSIRSSDFFHDSDERLSRVDSGSKVRQLFKKMTKKASRNAFSNENGWSRVDERLILSRDLSNVGASSGKNSISSSDISARLSSSGMSDDGIACWNFIFSRLFFDAQRSSRINSFIKERIQKSLSNMKTPSYVGGISCISLDLGSLPPHICNMRVLPVDEDDVWTIESDIEYAGGFSMEIETRFDLQEPDPQSDSEVASALLGDLEQNDQFLNLGNKTDAVGHSKSTGWASRYRSIMNYIAGQVSQVPVSLSVKISSLRGNLRILVKPPPSDRIWFGFTSTPEIELTLDASLGDCGLGGGHVISLLRSRIKTAIQDTMVLPNCESVAVPWMTAEKEDWIPRNVAPFGWFSRRHADPPATKSADLTVREIPPETRPAAAETAETAEEKPKVGWRARMKDQGKKMGGKLDEKRRHLEQRSRLLVEKMLENVEKRA